jgi:hypothetical protein
MAKAKDWKLPYSSEATSQVLRHEATDKLEDWTVHAAAMLTSRQGTDVPLAKPRGAYGCDPTDKDAPQALIVCRSLARHQTGGTNEGSFEANLSTGTRIVLRNLGKSFIGWP